MCLLCSSESMIFICDNCGKDVCHGCILSCKNCNIKVCIDCELNYCENCGKSGYCKKCIRECYFDCIIVTNRLMDKIFEKILEYNIDYNNIFCLKYQSEEKRIFPKFIKTIRLLKRVINRRYIRNRSTLKSRCRTIIMLNKIDYINENIPQDLKDYLNVTCK